MKKSNKGFSLVELIIVIAIMAILIAVLAPQYLKYVEKTKKNSDAKAFGEVVQATEVAIADPLNKINGNVTVSWDGHDFSFPTGATTELTKDVCNVINGDDSTTDLEAKSKAFASGGNSSVQFTVTSDGLWKKEAFGTFKDYVDY